MINERLKLAGTVELCLRSPDGKIKDNRKIENLVVNAGLAYIISRMVGTAKPAISHMALGAGTTAAASAQTDLIAMLGAREALDSTTIAGTNNEKVVYVASFEAGDATGAVTEAGLFNAATGGDMLCRTVFAVVNKAADDTMTVTWTITVSAV
jgi:hypothetical protein